MPTRQFSFSNTTYSNMAASNETQHITAQLEKLGISDVSSSVGDIQLFPHVNPVDIYRAQIIKKVSEITGADAQVVNNAVQWTQDLKHGDLVLPVAALRFKGKKPDELSAEIAEKFESPLIKKPTADKGFVRFFFEPTALAQLTGPIILKQKEQYGFNSSLGRTDPTDPNSPQKLVIVEYSSPNIAKEFHTGHLRSTIIGGFLVKMYERAGWKTLSMNYLGDWGKQYGVLSQGFEKSWTMMAEIPRMSAVASGSSICLYLSSFFFMTSCMKLCTSSRLSASEMTVPLRVLIV